MAGCVGKDEPATPGGGPTPDASPSTPTAASPATAAPSNGTTTSNATAETNGTKASDMPSDPGNCMRGMDMDGCTAAQADAWFDSQKANAPPPDKELPPVVIVLDAQGANTPGAFTIDAGTMRLLVHMYLNSTGPGPYAAVGPDGVGDMQLRFVGGDDTTTLTIGGRNVGVAPADPLANAFTAVLDMPAAGDWTLELEGQGSNAQLEVRLIERFSM